MRINEVAPGTPLGWCLAHSWHSVVVAAVMVMVVVCCSCLQELIHSRQQYESMCLLDDLGRILFRPLA